MTHEEEYEAHLRELLHRERLAHERAVKPIVDELVRIAHRRSPVAYVETSTGRLWLHRELHERASGEAVIPPSTEGRSRGVDPSDMASIVWRAEAIRLLWPSDREAAAGAAECCYDATFYAPAWCESDVLRGRNGSFPGLSRAGTSSLDQTAVAGGHQGG